MRGLIEQMSKKPVLGKNYHTCTLEGLGSRKDEFLEKIVQEMEAEGFRRSAPIEPFTPSLGLKDAISKSFGSYLEELIKYNMVGANAMLVSDKNGKLALRAETQGNDLRFGYYYAPSSEKLGSSDVGWLFILGFLVWSIVLFSIAVAFRESLGVLGAIFLSLMIIIPLAIRVGMSGRPSLSYYRKTREMEKEIDPFIVKTAESMGGKQITPFKKTTVELED